MRKTYTKVQYDKDGNKQCTTCKEYKDVSSFHKFNKASDGLKPSCKICVKSYDAKENDPKRKNPRKYNEAGQVHCMRCKEYLDESKFPQRNGGKYKTKIYKTRTYCIDCDKYMGHLDVYRKYNMTPEDYLRVEAEQGGVCKICKQDNNGSRLMVDHDHNCCPGVNTCGNCIRGLLCKNCNWALGNAKDDVAVLKKMIEYLNSYK